MAEKLRIEFELDEGRHCELCSQAERLGVTPEELARRAVNDWLNDISEEESGGNSGEA